MTTSFTQYVRDRKNRRKGLIVANLVEDDTLIIGWSLCKTTGKNPDNFNRARALSIANRRRDSEKYVICDINNQDSICDMIFDKRGKKGVEKVTDNIPHSIRRTMYRVINRSIHVSQKQQKQQKAQVTT